MAIYHICISSLYVNLVRLKRERMKKRGREVGEKYKFSLFGWWKKMKGKEYGVGDFPHEIIQISIPQIGERKEDEKCEKNAITILPFKLYHFLFLSCHFSTTKHKLHIKFQINFMNFTHRDRLVLHRLLNLDGVNGLLSLY